MTYEILYTSAPAGLKPGSSGYCTVKGSRGIPSPTLDLLESLSGYRHVFTPGTPEAAYNPVNWGHYLLRISGRMEHVLSRVSDCEPDYTGRSNKLAHHMVVDDAACPAGPAWLLGQRGWMTERWDGQVEQLSSVRTPPAARRAPGRCVAWEGLGLDPGWAGVMAESFLTDPDRKVFVIYKPGTNILPLFEEALSLLPENRRWDVTFATYGAALPSTVDCLWSGIVAGSPEVQQSRRFVNALRIDLTRPEPAQNGGALVDLARTGVARKAAPPPARSTPQRPVAPPIELAEVERPEPSQRRSPVPPPPDTLWEPEPPSLPPRQQGGSRAGLWIILSSALLVVCAAAGTTTYLIMNRPQPDAVAEGKEIAEPREKGATAVVADAGASKQVEHLTGQAPVGTNEGKPQGVPAAADPTKGAAMAAPQVGTMANPNETPAATETRPDTVLTAQPSPAAGPPSTKESPPPSVVAAAAGTVPSPMPRSGLGIALPVEVIPVTHKRSDTKGTTHYDFSPALKIPAKNSHLSLLLPRVKKTDDGPTPYHDLYSQRYVDGEIRMVPKGDLGVAAAPLLVASLKADSLTLALVESAQRDAQFKACLAHAGLLFQDPGTGQRVVFPIARSQSMTKPVPKSKDFIFRIPIPQDNATKTLAGLLRPEDVTLTDVVLALDGTVLTSKRSPDSPEFFWTVADEAKSPIRSIRVSQRAEISNGSLLVRIQCDPPFNSVTDALELQKKQLKADYDAIVNHFTQYIPEPTGNFAKQCLPSSRSQPFENASKAFRNAVIKGFDDVEKTLEKQKRPNSTDLANLHKERKEWLEKIDAYVSAVPGYTASRDRASGFEEKLTIVSGSVSLQIWPLEKGEATENIATLPDLKESWEVPWWTFDAETK